MRESTLLNKPAQIRANSLHFKQKRALARFCLAPRIPRKALT
jgi:hypothetical protein